MNRMVNVFKIVRVLSTLSLKTFFFCRQHPETNCALRFDTTFDWEENKEHQPKSTASFWEHISQIYYGNCRAQCSLWCTSSARFAKDSGAVVSKQFRYLPVIVLMNNA